MRRLLTILCAACLVFGIVATASATPFTGAVREDDGTLVGAGYWTDDDPAVNDAMLSWSVDFDAGTGWWTYAYVFTADEHALSHVIIQVSDSFTLANVKDGTTAFDSDDLKTYNPGDPGNSNPGLPGSIYGIKWEQAGSALTYSWTIVTDRAPMWGDFYAVDGKKPGEETYAYNSQYGVAPPPGYGSGNAGGWVLVPDTTVVPEPATMLLFGSGLIGLAAAGRKKLQKRHGNIA